ncbi:MAG TPA: hypothetical protein VG347_06375 [Verrucomicrobiae bacterium]|nr:hypothetical protein [Verrucomicrobiae bacterium]
MELKAIERTDRAKGRLNAALEIYRETILPEAQNPEKQIMYWIDHSHDDLTDEFRCFAIQHGRDVVGYLQYSYFREEHIFFFEYLCIRDTKLLGLVPSRAIGSIEDFLAQNYKPGFTIVFEVAQKRNAAGEWKTDKKVMDYFKRLGFRTIDFHYHYPVLQSYDGEFSYPADLMTRMPEGRTVVSSFEMRTILRCIYFKHYLRWDRPFLNSQRFSEREKLINELYSREVAQISGDDSFGTRGDEKRSRLGLFKSKQVRIGSLLERVFAPKLPRVIAVAVILLVVRKLLQNDVLFIPFVLTICAVYCLIEDTENSKKLFISIIAKLKVGRQR